MNDLQPNASQPQPDATVVIERKPPSLAWLVMLHGPRRGRIFRLKVQGSSVGRAVDNDIPLDDDSISRFHARVFADPEAPRPHFFVQDLASANGTFVNGERVVRHELRDDDHLQFGETVMVFKQLSP